MNVLRYVLLGLAACMLVVLGWRLASVPGPGRPPEAVPPEASAPARQEADQLAAARKLVEDRLTEVPQFAAFYRQLDEEFPRAYASVVDGFSHKLASTGTLPTPDAMLLETLRNVQQSQGILAARASGAQLTALFDARLALLDALAPQDPKRCADFLYGNADLPLAEFSAQHRDLVAALASQQVAAMKDGQDRHMDRETPTSADFDLIAHGLEARKLSPDEISVLLDGKTVDPPIPDSRLCEMGRIYLQTLRDLPEDSRKRVYGLAAELLARS